MLQRPASLERSMSTARRSPSKLEAMDSLAGDLAFKLFGQTIAVSLLQLPLPAEVSEIATINSSTATIARSCSQASSSDAMMHLEEERMASSVTTEERSFAFSRTEVPSGQLSCVKSRSRPLASRSGPMNCKREVDAADNRIPKEKPARKAEKVVACPRCDSLETKFCYYNNYNVNQPRHFCKNCQRYWTAGGTLRNVPVGAGRRKNKHGIMMLHRHVLPEQVSVRPDTQDGAQQRLPGCHPLRSLESPAAQSLPMEQQFVNPQEVGQGLIDLPHKFYTNVEAYQLEEVRRDMSKDQHVCGTFGNGRTDCRAHLRQVGREIVGVHGWRKGGFLAGASWSSVPGWACTWGLHQWPSSVELGYVTAVSDPYMQTSSSTYRRKSDTESPAGQLGASKGGMSSCQFGSAIDPGWSAKDSTWMSAGLSSCSETIGSGKTFFPVVRGKVLDGENDLISGRHVNPAAMIRSMAFHERL